MAIKFSADEMLQIACRIEQNGAAFYSAAAETVTAPYTAALLKRLSDWEVGHGVLFAQMREALTADEREATTYDPDDEIGLYLQALADGVVFAAQQDVKALFDAQPTLEWILRTAMGKEQESIVFYTGMRDHVPARLGREKIDHIIKEEMYHLSILHKELNMLSS